MAIRAVVLERENVNLKQGNITLIYWKVRMIIVILADAAFTSFILSATSQ